MLSLNDSMFLIRLKCPPQTLRKQLHTFDHYQRARAPSRKNNNYSFTQTLNKPLLVHAVNTVDHNHGLSSLRPEPSGMHGTLSETNPPMMLKLTM